MLKRFSSRREPLQESFLKPYLTGAKSYQRIAGYFNSSLLDLAAEELFQIPKVYIICNADIRPGDLQAVRQARGLRKQELEECVLRKVWNQGDFLRLVDIYGQRLQNRFQILYQLLAKTGNGRDF